METKTKRRRRVTSRNGWLGKNFETLPVSVGLVLLVVVAAFYGFAIIMMMPSGMWSKSFGQNICGGGRVSGVQEVNTLAR